MEVVSSIFIKEEPCLEETESEQSIPAAENYTIKEESHLEEREEEQLVDQCGFSDINRLLKVELAEEETTKEQYSEEYIVPDLSPAIREEADEIENGYYTCKTSFLTCVNNITDEGVRPGSVNYKEQTPSSNQCEINSSCNDLVSSALPEQQTSVDRKKTYRSNVCYKIIAHENNLSAWAVSLSEHKLCHANVKKVEYIKYQCDICSKAFSTSRSLLDHKLIHTNVKTFQCDICNNLFTTSDGLRKHKLSHISFEKYQCKICDKSFVRSTNLSQHIKNVHLGVKRFHCDVCNKTFTRPESLTRHKFITHGLM